MNNEKTEVREVSFNDALRLILRNEGLEAERRGVEFTKERAGNAVKYFKENKTFKYFMVNDYALIAVCYRKEYNTNEISEIYVSEKHRRRNFASKLFETALDKMKNKDWIVEVNASNTQAIRFYEKMGFKRYKTIENKQYDKPFSTILMLKTVNGSANFETAKNKKAS